MQLTNRTMVAMIEITIKKQLLWRLPSNERVGLDGRQNRVIAACGQYCRCAGPCSRLFSRRGYNIESLTVGVTADPRYSRMTVVSLGDQTVLEQIKNQSINWRM